VASIFGTLEGGIVGGAVAIGTAAAVEPVVEPAKQEVWLANPFKVLEPAALAMLVAQGLVDFDPAAEQAQRSGIDANKFRALVELALRGPPVSEALDLRRRGKISDAGLTHALEKAQIEPQYWAAIKELTDERLGAPVIALAIVRGIINDPGFLPVGPPSAEGKVKAFPKSTLDALEEAAATGFNSDRLFVETAIAGRPMGPESAAAATFRQILERVDFDRAIAEGDVRNEWADAIFETARQIPSVADYVNAHLRGHIDVAAMNAGSARHGMSPEDTNLIYLRTGRPAAPGQMATAAVRGIDGPAGRPMDREQFLLGIAESDIRPEWGPMLWESRFLYPSLFQLTRLVTSGAIDAATGVEWARKARYAPEVLTALEASWTQGGTATKHPNVVKAENQLWTATHKAYINHELDDAQATTELTTIHADPTVIPTILDLWKHERGLVRSTLTKAQIKKAWKEPAINAATGQPWTTDEAIAALTDLGMSPTDAQSYLNI
jgi:hypothetical protein